MDVRFFSAGYKHHEPPTTMVHVLQRPRMRSRHPQSTYETHFAARRHRVTACSVTSGHVNAKTAAQYNGEMQEKISVSPAYGHSWLNVCQKKADGVGSSMYPWRAEALEPLLSSGGAIMGRAHAP